MNKPVAFSQAPMPTKPVEAPNVRNYALGALAFGMISILGAVFLGHDIAHITSSRESFSIALTDTVLAGGLAAYLANAVNANYRKKVKVEALQASIDSIKQGFAESTKEQKINLIRAIYEGFSEKVPRQHVPALEDFGVKLSLQLEDPAELLKEMHPCDYIKFRNALNRMPTSNLSSDEQKKRAQYLQERQLFENITLENIKAEKQVDFIHRLYQECPGASSIDISNLQDLGAKLSCQMEATNCNLLLNKMSPTELSKFKSGLRSMENVNELPHVAQRRRQICLDWNHLRN